MALAAALALAAAACVTTGEGRRMRADLDRLRERLEVMERRDAEINEQVARLRKVLGEATALLSRNSADVGARVQKSEGDLAVVAGQIEEARHLVGELQKKVLETDARLGTLEQSHGKLVDRVAPAIPEDKETLWKEAQSRLHGGMRDDGRRFLRSFVQRFPQDGRAPAAMLLLGQSFATEGKHSLAAAEYQKVLDAHPRAPEVAEAMWLLAQAFVELKFCSDARVLLDDVLKRYPKSPRAAEIKAKLKEIQKIARDKKLCTS